MTSLARCLLACLAALAVLTILAGCTPIRAPAADASPATLSPVLTPSIVQDALANACPVTEPQWIKAPDDAAVQNPPAYGHYFVNPDRSIWASAGWTGQEETYLRAGKDGVKVGWFRPAGATLEIAGQRLDGDAPPLEAHIPCCYPTRFQATGLVFPTPGCWEVSAKAGESALTFVVRVEP